MSDKYILVDKEPIPVDDIIEWAQWFESNSRIVKQDKVGDILVSTVFLGLDHSFMGGNHELFETMIFGGKEDGYQERYSTWDEAEKGHQTALSKLKS